IAALAAAIALMYSVTWYWSSKEVRHGQDYSWLTLLMGGAWLGIAGRLFPWLGLGFRLDVCEGRNRAAALAMFGAILGATFLFCGSNIGEGPSFWNNVFCLLLGGG